MRVVARHDRGLDQQAKELCNLRGVRDCIRAAVKRDSQGCGRRCRNGFELGYLLVAKWLFRIPSKDELERREDGHGYDDQRKRRGDFKAFETPTCFGHLHS